MNQTTMEFFKRYLIISLVYLIGALGAEWRTVWRDDFDGPAGSQPSRSNWIFDTGTSYPGGPMTWGTGEIQTYTTNVENLSIDGNGILRITPRRDSAGRWTSARIETQRTDFKPKPGSKLAIEARIQLPDVIGNKAIGYWPAFWAIGSPFRGNYQNWPSIGEFDIMESVNGENFIKAVVHCGTENGGPCNEKEGRGRERGCTGPRCEFAFHVFRFEWDESIANPEFRWYLDGQFFYRVTKRDLGAKTWGDITKHGYFLLLNVAMGGGYPNDRAKRKTPLPETEPGHPMRIDYVAVFEYV